MALDSSFMMDARATPDDVRAVLLESGYFEALPDDRNTKRVCADAALISIYKPEGRNFTAEEAGIRATIQVFVSCTDKTRTHDWTLNTVRAVMVLLRAYPGDALFLYSTDNPALLRKSGEIILDRRSSLWTPERMLALMDLPHTFGEIALS